MFFWIQEERSCAISECVVVVDVGRFCGGGD